MGKLTNNHGLPRPVADAIQPDTYFACGSADYSATSLIQSPRQLQLSKRHRHELQKDVTDMWAFFIGNCVHEKLERELKRYPERYLIERKITEFDMGRKVVAKFDAYDMETKVLYDHKTSKIGARAAKKLWTEFKKEWEDQLNINAYFLEREGYEVDTLGISLVFTDWKPLMAKFKSADEYPEAPSVELHAPAATFDERKKFYEERLALHIAHEDTPDDELPYCTEEECWASDPSWRVENKKTGRSRKNCKSELEAHAWMEQNIKPAQLANYHIIKKEGSRLKCEAFCDCAPFCNQYKEYMANK